MINLIFRGFQILFIYAIGCHSGPQPSDNDVVIVKKDLQMCKEKLSQEQKLHKQEKTRLKIHLKNTRYNNQVYQRMIKVRIKFLTQYYTDSACVFLKSLATLKLIICPL